jgi:hypothetical protein
MKSQQPASGILLTHQFDNATSYHIECDCSESDHAVKMWIELESDHELDLITLKFYVNTWTPFWETGFNRIKTAWKVLTTGSHQQQHCLLLSKQSAINLASTISTNVNKLETNK